MLHGAPCFAAVPPANDLRDGCSRDERRRKVGKRGGGDDRLGCCGNPANKVVAALWVEFREGVVEEEHGWTPLLVDEQVDLGEQEGEEDAALLPARRDVGHVAAAHVERGVVAVWPDKRVSLVDLGCRGAAQGCREFPCYLFASCPLLIALPRAVRHGERRFVGRDLAVRKRTTDVAAQLGPVQTAARRHGLRTPIVDRLVALITDIEQGRATMGPALADDLGMVAERR